MMAGKDSNSPQPLVPPAADAEAATANSRELRKKKRIKYLLYFIAFVIFQTAVIAIFVLTIMKVRTPKFRVRSATFDPANFKSDTSSFNFTMDARIDVKNANFGKYKYEDTTVNFFYRGTPVGEVMIPKSSVGWRSTKKVNALVNLGSAMIEQSKPELGTDLKTGVLRITSNAEMKGKVKLIFIFSKKKSTNMDCSMDIVIASKQLVNISCK